MKVIFVYISHGFQVRNFLNSGMCEELARDFRIVFLTWPEDVAELQAHVGALGTVEALPYTPRALEAKLALVRRYVMVNPRRNKTVNLFSMGMRRDNPKLYWALRIVNLTAGRWAFVRSTWTALERALLPLADMLALIDRHKPSAVVTANYGADPEVMRLFTAARRRRVPTAAIVPSWDNLSSKGVMGAQADRLVVWNEIMRDEARIFHDFPAERVTIAGPVQFDVYGPGRERLTREQVATAIGIDPARPYIVYGTISPFLFRYNTEIVRHLAELVAAGELEGAPQIVVRVHPQVVDDPSFGEKLDVYLELEKAFPGIVFVNVPEIMRWGRLRPAPASDQELLTALLQHAAVTLVPGSTLAIDAMVAGCPAIGIAYDGDHDEPYPTSIQRWYDYDYFQPIMKAQALPLARSRADMKAKINDLLSNRESNLPQRNRVVAEMIGVVDGKAAERAAAAVRELAGAPL